MNKMKPIRQRLHFSKQGASYGLPWTVHNSKGCHSFSHVVIYGSAETESNPSKKNNPRYFITLIGTLHSIGRVGILTAHKRPVGLRKAKKNG